MMTWLTAALVAAGAGFVAELGDKSQLLTAGMAARFGRRTLLVGVAVGVTAVQALATTVGAVLGTVLPEGLLGVAAAALFLAVGAWMWWDARRAGGGPAGDERTDPGGPSPGPVRTAAGVSLRAVLVVAGAFTVGELGDKTQLTTIALASREDPTAVLVGGVVGVFLANVLAIEAGLALARVLPRSVVQRVSAGVFVAAGLVLSGLALLELSG